VAAAKVLLPLPDRDFDITETAVPWRRLTDAGYDVVFTTQSGGTPAGDPLLIDGLFAMLRASPEAVAHYREMEASPRFKETLPWAEVEPADYAGVWLPGGHAKGMRQLLEGEVFFDKLRAFWALDDGSRPVAAVCHGVIVLARAGLLEGVRTTCLPGYMERSAYLLTFWKWGDYYRTYPEYVEAEVCNAAGKANFVRGPLNLFGNKAERHAFVCEDGRYVSGRWPGDVELLTARFMERLEARAASDAGEARQAAS
jgi:putative intracellular protease/amidase